MARLLVFVPVIYGLLWVSDASPDLRDYLYPWLESLRGPEPFSRPIGNYSPPYLYLLWLAGKLGLPALHTIKLLSVLGTLCLALAVRRLAGNEAAIVALLLPTVALNGPFLGQCDAIWVACCVMAVAMDRRVHAMAAWAGLAFAFKAQAAFLAPYCVLMVWQERKWLVLLIPPAVYLLAIMPAALAGWPLVDLLTVYARQVGYPGFGNAPNLWALASTMIDWRDPPHALLMAGYAAGLAGLLAYLWRRPNPTLAAALFSAILLPFLLPKMHERFFFLADILALCLALSDKRFVPVFLAVQAGSLLAYLDYMSGFTALRVIGSGCMAFALWRLGWPERHRDGAPSARGVIVPAAP